MKLIFIKPCILDWKTGIWAYKKARSSRYSDYQILKTQRNYLRNSNDFCRRWKNYRWYSTRYFSVR